MTLRRTPRRKWRIAIRHKNGFWTITNEIDTYAFVHESEFSKYDLDQEDIDVFRGKGGQSTV